MFLILSIVLLVNFTWMTLIFYAVYVLEASYTMLWKFRNSKLLQICFEWPHV